MTQAQLQLGSKVRLSGGYSVAPEWLADLPFIGGVIVGFIPGQNQSKACVVKLDQAITCLGVTGQHVVLELRYVGKDWTSPATVHVELCNFVPDPLPWKHRQQGRWVESHATCELALN